MKEILRDRDFMKVGHIQSLLEAAGIATFMRNETVSNTEISIPDFFPAVCVANDADYERAMILIKEHFAESQEQSSAERICENCGAQNPSSFDVCWNCDESIEEKKPNNN
jgi:ribosomal protein L40E